MFEGNSQVLDHILVSPALCSPGRPDYDVVHVNAEFADQASDHDPSVAKLTLNDPPTVDAGGPYTVWAGFTVSVSATGSDPNGDPLTYAWDLDDNGSFETTGQTVTYSAATAMAPGPHTIARAGHGHRRPRGRRHGGRQRRRHLRQPLRTGAGSVTKKAPSRTISARSWRRREGRGQGQDQGPRQEARGVPQEGRARDGQGGQRRRAAQLKSLSQYL